MRSHSKNRKNDLLHVRISAQDKQKYCMEAKKMNMNLSQYVLHLLKHKKINCIEGGTELAREIYHLNQRLDQFDACANLPAQELRDAATQGIEAIMAHVKKMEQDDDSCPS